MVFVLVTIEVAVFPVTIVMVMFPIFVPFSFFAAVPLTIAGSERPALPWKVIQYLKIAL